MTSVDTTAGAPHPPPPEQRAPELLCAIDIGTNSVHSVLARVGAGDRFEIVTREKEMVRLGSGPGDMKRLTPDAIERGIGALRRARALADSHGAPVYAVATSAVREAENAGDFLDRARREAGVDVEVISGVEEARLIHLGVLQAVPVFDQRALLIDIGGGSTEVLLGQRGEVLEVRSFKLGSIRLTWRFFRTDLLHPGATDACRRFVRSAIDPMVREAERHGFDVVVGSSGTIETVAAMALARAGGEVPRSLNSATVTRAEVDAVVADLLRCKRVEDRRSLPGIDPARADILLAGALILEQLLHATGAEGLTVSDYALREGVLLDGLHRLRGGTLHHLHDLRRRSVDHLMELFYADDEDRRHGQHVAGLALQLFDQLRPRHRLGDGPRELLEAAALLANVGLYLSHAKHHQHSYYVIRNSEHLMGFNDREIELIALVARYHRKSAPKPAHPGYDRLGAEDREVVRALAGLLRVAIGLDRSHAQVVRSVAVRSERRRVRVVAEVLPGADASLELFTACERRHLLEEVLGVPVQVVAEPG